jgi:Zn-dependent protease with chaperone function
MMMGFPMTALRVVTLGPALLASFVLTVVVCALLPPVLGLAVFLSAVGLLVALALGQLEGPAISVLTRSRPATESALQVMAPVLAELGGRGVDIDVLFVRRAPQPNTPVAVAIARSAVVVTPGLVESTYRGEVTVVEAAAVLGHALGRHRAIRPHLELAVLAATTPWRLVRVAVGGAGRAFAWLPLMQLAWTLRGVVGVICVVQSVIEGRTPAGLLGGTVIALTYLVPAAGRAIELRTEHDADHLVLELGLGDVLAGLLRRYGHPIPIERAQRLEAVVQPHQRPRLHVVRS